MNYPEKKMVRFLCQCQRVKVVKKFTIRNLNLKKIVQMLITRVANLIFSSVDRFWNDFKNLTNVYFRNEEIQYYVYFGWTLHVLFCSIDISVQHREVTYYFTRNL